MRSERRVHVPRLRLALVGLLACAAFLAQGGAGVMARSAATAPTTIAELHFGDVHSVRAWNGLQAWNDYDPGDMRWHVFVRSGGQISAPPAIPAGDERVRVDVGPGPDGRPALAFLSCADVCQVVVSALDGGKARLVPGSTGATAATIWGSRVVWVRGSKTVLTSRLDGGAMERVPGPPRGYGVGALELHGSRLAFIASSGAEGGQTEVRMESLRGGRQLLVAAMSWGSGGQRFRGPSWAGGKLFFYMSRPARRLAGPYRYDPRSGRYAKAPHAAVGGLSGFAMDDDGRRAFEALDPFFDIGAEPEDVTRLQLTSPLTFTPTRAPLPRR